MARSRLLSPMVFVRRAALYKGLFGGSRGWLMIGSVIWGKKLLSRLFGKNEEVVSTEVLKKGQFVRIESGAPLTRKERNMVRKATRKS